MPSLAERGIIVPEQSGEKLIYHPVRLSELEPIARFTDHLIIPNVGILASEPDDAFGRPFGRDGAIVAGLKFAAHRLDPNVDRQAETGEAILTMLDFLPEVDIPEAGIERGKMFHERGKREEGYPKIWYVNEEEIGQNHDTVDATDRFLNVAYDLWNKNPDLREKLLPKIALMAEWSIRNTTQFGAAAYIPADKAVEAGFRKFEGLKVQRWRDCGFSTLLDDGSEPEGFIAPVEEQGLRWAALHKAADMLQEYNPLLSEEARMAADYIQEMFREKFVYKDDDGYFFADGIDGAGNVMHAVTVDAIGVLAPRYKGKAIIDDIEITQDVMKRSFEKLYDPRGGLKTVSSDSFVHEMNIYQGDKSVWPQAQAHAVQALLGEAERWQETNVEVSQNFRAHALKLAEAALRPGAYYDAPIETAQLLEDGDVDVYRESTGDGERTSSLFQAWTGATFDYLMAVLRAHGITEIQIYSSQEGPRRFNRSGPGAIKSEELATVV